MKVAIIGAGPSGLTTAKYLKNYNLEYDIYERRGTIGGVWRDRDEPGNHSEEDIIAWSPIYDTLKSNTPIDTMKFDGLDYESGKDCFIPWKEVNNYLKNYADKFGLLDHCKLQTEVVQVSYINDKWKVAARHTPTDKMTEKYYDAVVICSGHEEIPRIPEYKGASSFEGRQIHSKKFRHPDQFRDMTVLVIGVGPSGIDIAIQSSFTAKMVYLSHHRPALENAKFPKNLIQKPDVKSFSKDSVLFEDETEVKIDAVIYSTGYEYNYQYLDETCGIKLGDRYVKNLYKQMISIEHPSLIFCGVHSLFFIFPLADLQGKVAARVIGGDVTLPSKQEMLEDTKKWEEWNRSEGRGENKYFHLEWRSRGYFRDLCRTANLPEPSEALFDMYNVFYHNYRHQPFFLKKHNYKIVDSKFVYEPYELNL